jgi:hypothetical protein
MSHPIDVFQTQEEVRAFLKNIQHPKLNAFRKTMTTQPFSSLISWVANPQAIMAMFEDKNIGDDQFEVVCAAAMLAISDELDRRMPVSHLVGLDGA